MRDSGGVGPKGVAELLDGGVRLYLSRFWPFFAVPFVCGLAANLLAAVWSGPLPVGVSLPPFLHALSGKSALLPSPGAMLVAAALQMLGAAAVLVQAGRAVSDPGGPLPPEQAVGPALTRLWPYFVTALITALVFGLGVLTALIVTVLAAGWWSVAGVVCILEGRRATAALGRSRALVRGHFWHAFGTVFLAGLVGMVASLLLLVLGSPLMAMPGSAGMFFHLAWSAATQAVVTPYALLVSTLLYFDLRNRKEGLDLAGQEPAALS